MTTNYIAQSCAGCNLDTARLSIRGLCKPCEFETLSQSNGVFTSTVKDNGMVSIVFNLNDIDFRDVGTQFDLYGGDPIPEDQVIERQVAIIHEALFEVIDLTKGMLVGRCDGQVRVCFAGQERTYKVRAYDLRRGLISIEVWPNSGDLGFLVTALVAPTPMAPLTPWVQPEDSNGLEPALSN
jgi:hypothetical protein